MFVVLFFLRANISRGWCCYTCPLVPMSHFPLRPGSSCAPLQMDPTDLHALGGFHSSTLHPINLFQTYGETDRLWLQSLFYKSISNIQREKIFQNSFVIHQGNWKPSKDPAKSPCQFSVGHKVQTWLPSSLLYVIYLFTKFTGSLDSVRPAVMLMLCKWWKLWSVRSGRSI